MAMYDAFSETFANSRKGKRWKEIDMILAKFSECFSQEALFSVLDVGCGSGRFYGFLREKFPCAIYRGVDISWGMISLAKKEFGDFFEVGDMAKLDNFDTQFSAIVSIAAFHHLTTQKDRLDALGGFYKNLRDDGILVFTVWNLLSPRNLEKYGEYRDKENDFQIKIGAHTRYYHGFVRAEVWQLLDEAGFMEISPTLFDTDENLVFIARKKLFF